MPKAQRLKSKGLQIEVSCISHVIMSQQDIYHVFLPRWSVCSHSCGEGSQTRRVECVLGGRSGIYCHIFAYIRIYSHIFAYIRIYWHILAYTGIYWYILPYTGIYWHILVYIAIYWHILAYRHIVNQKYMHHY